MPHYLLLKVWFSQWVGLQKEELLVNMNIYFYLCLSLHCLPPLSGIIVLIAVAEIAISPVELLIKSHNFFVAL